LSFKNINISFLTILDQDIKEKLLRLGRIFMNLRMLKTWSKITSMEP